jgi:hypothetical protein
MPPAPPLVINFGIALTVEVLWQATNQNHRLKIALVDRDQQVVPLFRLPPGVVLPDGEQEGVINANFNVGRSASMEVGEDTIMPLAFQFPGLPIPRLGAYKIVVEIDQTEVAYARFRAVAAQPALTFGPSPLPQPDRSI